VIDYVPDTDVSNMAILQNSEVGGKTEAPYIVTLQTPLPWIYITCLNHLKAKLNPIRHLLALLGAHHILHVSRIRVNLYYLS